MASAKLTTAEKVKNYQKQVALKGNHFDKVNHLYSNKVNANKIDLDRREENLDKVQNAKANAEVTANAYIRSVQNFNDPDHEKCRTEFYNKFSNNETLLRNHITKQYLAKEGIPENLPRNLGYENKMLNTRIKNGVTLSIASLNDNNDIATVAKFRSLLQNKWAAEGYSNTDAVIEEFWQDHHLSYDPL